MYFIELIVKHFKKKKDNADKYILESDTTPKTDEECKEHFFMPLDNSGEILACRNCGLVVNKKNLKDINFFRSNTDN